MADLPAFGLARRNCGVDPAIGAQLNVYPVESFFLFHWGLPCGMRSLFHRGATYLTGVAPGDGTGVYPVKRIVTTQTEWKEHHIGFV